MACTKRQYRSRTVAERAMFKHWRTGRGAKLPVRAYKCPRCDRWHLTSQARRSA